MMWPMKSKKSEDRKPKAEIFGLRTSVLGILFSLLCFLTDQGWGQIVKVELDKKSPVNAAVRSVFFPGAGQHFNEERVKGYIFNISGTIMGTATLLLFQRADDKYDDYVAKGKKDDLLYNDYKRKYTQAQVAGMITGAVWLSSIIDAYLTGKKLAGGRDFSLLPHEDGGILICLHKKF